MSRQETKSEGLSGSVASDSETLIGAYLKDVRKIPLLTAEEECELARQILNGDEGARYRMITANLRLVVKIAKAYVNRGVPFMDLIAEGNIGLMKGAEKFNADHGCRFSTYGSWWIKQAIERAVFKHGRTVRVPVHVMEEAEKLKRVEKKLALDLGREPTSEEVAEFSGFTAAHIEMLKNSTQPMYYLESAVDEDGDVFFNQALTEENEDTADEILWGEECRQLLGEGLMALDERERTVLGMRFGIDGHSPQTLKEIGELMGVTRERVRQIEREAMSHLRTVLGHDEEAA